MYFNILRAERARREMQKSLEGRKRRENCCTYIKMSNIKINI